MTGFFFVLMSMLSVKAWASQSYSVGVHDFQFFDSSRDRRVMVHVWYPIDAKISVRPYQAKGPFRPVMAKVDAAIAVGPRKFPVVLASHGSMGLANRLFWLAETLVKSGIVVIAVDHPGNMFGNTSGDGVMRVWDRARDLSLALDEVGKNPQFMNSLDFSRVSAVGHSAGGAAVLLLGGARFSFDRFSNPIPQCKGSGDPYYEKQCQQLLSLDPQSYGKKIIEGDYSDKRVRSVLALDPGFVRSFRSESLKKMKSVFVFIADQLELPQDEIYSKDFEKILRPDQWETMPGSLHMTFLQACKPKLNDSKDPELKGLCSGTDMKLQLQKKVSKKAHDFFRGNWN